MLGGIFGTFVLGAMAAALPPLTVPLLVIGILGWGRLLLYWARLLFATRTGE